MSLAPKLTVTKAKLAANRANGARARGPATPDGRERSAAAHLRHGYYSRAAQVTLRALGEDPAEFHRRAESLATTYQPDGALETGLVMQMARALWRLERYHRIADSIAAKHLEKARVRARQVNSLTCLPLIGKIERLKKILYGCLDPEFVFGLEERQFFEAARGDVPPHTAREILSRLLRLRAPGTPEDAGPSADLLDEHEPIPAAEGEERKAVCGELIRLIDPIVNQFTERVMRPAEDPDEGRAQIDRDVILAEGESQAALMHRAEESSLRQLWRTTNILLKLRRAAEYKKMLEMKDEPTELLKTG